MANAVTHTEKEKAPASRAVANSLAGVATAGTAEKVKAIRKNPTALPDQVKHNAESLSGLSLDDVKIEFSSPLPGRFGANALAAGSDIYVGSGGERSLAHEAWHVVQQKQGRVPATGQAAGMPVNRDARLESEAERMSRLLMEPFDPGRRGPAPALIQRVSDQSVFQGDSGLKEPVGTGLQYVWIDVPGDGSCLFYSVLMSAVAAGMLAQFRSDEYAGATPDAIADAVEERTAAMLGVERENFEAELENYQLEQRNVVANFWQAHLAAFQPALRNDIRSILFQYLAGRQMFRGNLAAAALVDSKEPAAAGKDADKGPKDADKPPMKDSPKAVSSKDPGRKAETEFDRHLEAEAATGKAEGEKLDKFLTKVQTEYDPKGGSEEDDWKDDELGSGLGVPTKKDPAAKKAAILVSREKAGISKDLKGAGDKGKIAAYVDSPNNRVARIETTPVGSGVPAGSAFDRAVRELILQKLAVKIGAAQPLDFVTGDFNDANIDGLVDGYRQVFRAAKVFAGEAALEALRQQNGIQIRTQVYQSDTERILGDDNPADRVRILEEPAHFQVLVGPFRAGHLLPNGGIGGNQEPAGAGSADYDKDIAYQGGSIVKAECFQPLVANPLRLLEIGAVVDPKEKVEVIVADDGGRKTLSGWLKKRIEEGHALSPLFQQLGNDIFSVKAPSNEAELKGFVIELAERLQSLKAPEVEAGERHPLAKPLRDAAFLFVRNNRIYLSDGTRLGIVLQRMMHGPLSTGKTHVGAALVHEITGELAGMEQQLASPLIPGPANIGRIAGGLDHLAELLRLQSLDEATRVRFMPQQRLEFKVFLPTVEAMRKYMGDSAAFLRDQYEKEVMRQVSIQLKYLNEMRLDEWMLHRDLFNIRVPDRRGPIFEKRSTSHKQSVLDALLLRNVDVAEQMKMSGNTGKKKQRVSGVNNKLAAMIKSKPGDAFDYMMKRRDRVDELGKGRKFDPAEELSEEDILDLLTKTLETVYSTGTISEEGEVITRAIVADLVGRANPQSKWKKLNLEWLTATAVAMYKEWSGLLPRTDDPLKGLAILHNPDQVAGGERELPELEEDADISDFLGPGIVNGAIGAAWGLSEVEGSVNNAQRLENMLAKGFPEACWPLLRMNVVLIVQIGRGGYLVPGSGKEGIRKRKPIPKR